MRGQIQSRSNKFSSPQSSRLWRVSTNTHTKVQKQSIKSTTQTSGATRLHHRIYPITATHRSRCPSSRIESLYTFSSTYPSRVPLNANLGVLTECLPVEIENLLPALKPLPVKNISSVMLSLIYGLGRYIFCFSATFPLLYHHSDPRPPLRLSATPVPQDANA